MARAGNNHKGGRPKGKKSINTLEKEAALKVFSNKVASVADKLFRIQFLKAQGTHRMVTIDKDEEGKVRVMKVNDEERMDELITAGEYGKDYHILAGHDPDWRAADSMLDRAFGRAAQAIDLTSKGEQIITATPEALKLAKEYEEKIKRGL